LVKYNKKTLAKRNPMVYVNWACFGANGGAGTCCRKCATGDRELGEVAESEERKWRIGAGNVAPKFGAEKSNKSGVRG
jgi:hypothetical protein